MPTFVYRAVNRGGQVIRGERDAADEAAMIAWLQAQQFLPVRLGVRRNRLGGWRLGGRGRPLGARARALLARELATLLDAELTLDQALSLLQRLDPAGSASALVGRVLARVESGSGFAAALAAEPASFDAAYVALVRAGETSGALPQILARLADALERSRKLREQIRSGLVYPMVLVVGAIASVLVLLTVVVPSFAPLFADAGRSLPPATRAVMAAADAIELGGPAALAAILLVALGYRRLPADSPWRLAMHRRLIGLPLVGPLLLKIDLGRYARTLAILLANGVPLVSALDLARATVRNRALAAALLPLGQAVRSGGRLAAALLARPELPRLFGELVGVGEETGRLPPMLDTLAESYEDDVARGSERLLALLTPAITLVLGGVVAGVLAAMLSAVLAINDLAL